MSGVLNIGRFAKILISIKEGILKKKSYERRKVDEKNLSQLSYITKKDEKQN